MHHSTHSAARQKHGGHDAIIEKTIKHDQNSRAGSAAVERALVIVLPHPHLLLGSPNSKVLSDATLLSQAISEMSLLQLVTTERWRASERTNERTCPLRRCCLTLSFLLSRSFGSCFVSGFFCDGCGTADG
jgi:hypothetical protein